MADAAAVAGADDFGDPAFLGPLALLVDGCAASGNLSHTGWKVLRSVVRRHLVNRVHIQAHLRTHPAGAERDVGAPLVVTGLPRTGTSLLHNLLAQDPRHRFLRLWEALHPVPPEVDGGPDEAALVAQAETWLARFYAHAPQFRAIHPLTARGPEECDALLQNAFASLHFDDMFDAEAYSRWFWEGDLDDAYAYYALQLRVLAGAAAGRGRWLLKSPGHLGHLASLLRVLPDAVVLHCHRDPVEAVASYASLMRTLRARNSDVVALPRLGAQALSRCRTALRRALAVRAAHPAGAFLDVSYPALVADPLATVACIYERLDLALTPAVEAGMRRWLAEHPQHRHGVHRYEPAEFQLSARRVRDAFAPYLERFGALTAVQRR